MYRSPIEIIYGELKNEMDGNILRVVQDHGFHVDRIELLRALKYDRDQYYKGFRDGVDSATKHGQWIFGVVNHHEWMKCSECLVSQTPTGVFVYCPSCGAKMDLLDELSGTPDPADPV
jgi:hypothetical protein